MGKVWSVANTAVGTVCAVLSALFGYLSWRDGQPSPSVSQAPSAAPAGNLTGWAVAFGLVALCMLALGGIGWRRRRELTTEARAPVPPSESMFHADTGGSINAKNAELPASLAGMFSKGFARASTGGMIHTPGIKVIDLKDGTFRVEPHRLVERDTCIQDAMMYAVNRRWPQPEEKLRDGQTGAASDALQKMRELAGDGKFTIWGKLVDKI